MFYSYGLCTVRHNTMDTLSEHSESSENSDAASVVVNPRLTEQTVPPESLVEPDTEIVNDDASKTDMLQDIINIFDEIKPDYDIDLTDDDQKDENADGEADHSNDANDVAIICESEDNPPDSVPAEMEVVVVEQTQDEINKNNHNTQNGFPYRSGHLTVRSE